MLWVIALLALTSAQDPKAPLQALVPNADLGNKEHKLHIPRLDEPANSSTETAGVLSLAKVEAKPVADITVCVPCIPRDITSLPNLMRSIRDNTMAPAQVVVAISETPNNEAQELERMLQSIFPNVMVVATEEQQYAGENRNRAASRVSTSFLTFIDADDEMHFERIQIVTEALQEFGSKCLVHTFSFKRDEVKKHFNWRSANRKMGSRIYQDILKSEHATSIAPDGPGLHLSWVHHGHPSCRREVLRDVPYTARARGQDCYFLRQALAHYGNHDSSLVFIELPLTVYHPSEHPDNGWTKDYRVQLASLQERVISFSVKHRQA